MIVQKIDISLSKGKAPDLIAHYGESGRQILMVPDAEIPEGSAVSIEIVKPDATFAIQTGTITEEGFVITIPDQACTYKGLCYYILKVTYDNDVIYSAAGSLFVDDHLLTDELIESVAAANGYVFPDDFATVGDIEELEDMIEANPEGEPEEVLTSVKIKGVIYSIPAGGGSTYASIARSINNEGIEGGVI